MKKFFIFMIAVCVFAVSAEAWAQSYRDRARHEARSAADIILKEEYTSSVMSDCYRKVYGGSSRPQKGISSRIIRELSSCMSNKGIELDMSADQNAGYDDVFNLNHKGERLLEGYAAEKNLNFPKAELNVKRIERNTSRNQGRKSSKRKLYVRPEDASKTKKPIHLFNNVR
jgi:hypothetical protein